MLQFTKLANVYWGLCALLQFYPAIRTANPVLVLFFVLVVVMIGVLKEWASDIKRQRADTVVNNSVYSRVTSFKNEEKFSSTMNTLLRDSQPD